MTDWLSELDRLEREATAGPWHAHDTGIGRAGGTGIIDEVFWGTHTPDYGAGYDEKDGALVCLLRNHARELIEAKQRQRSFKCFMCEGDLVELEVENHITKVHDRFGNLVRLDNNGQGLRFTCTLGCSGNVERPNGWGRAKP